VTQRDFNIVHTVDRHLKLEQYPVTAKRIKSSVHVHHEKQSIRISGRAAASCYSPELLRAARSLATDTHGSLRALFKMLSFPELGHFKSTKTADWDVWISGGGLDAIIPRVGTSQVDLSNIKITLGRPNSQENL